MIKILKNLKTKDWLLILLEVAILCGCVYLELLLPDYMKDITVIIQSGTNSINDVWIAGGKMIACALGSTVGSIISTFISSYVSADLSYETREKLFNHIMDLDTTRMKNFSAASLITRTTNDITQIQMIISMGLMMLIKAPILAITAIIKIVNKSLELSLLTAAAVVVIVGTILIIMYLVLPRFKLVQKLTDDVNRIARETLTGNKVVRAFNAEDYEQEKFDEKNNELINTQIFNRTAFSFMSPVMSLVMSSLTLFIYWIGASLINGAEMASKVEVFGNIMVFSSYAMYVIQAFMFLAMIFMMLPRAQVSAKRINEVMETPLAINEGTLSEVKEEGTLEFKNVSFHYGDGKDVLENITFKVNKGETIAFIGATGCGKSTIVGLASRLYDASKGEVLVDGVNIKDLTFDTLYSKVALVSQKAELFSDTIKDNVTFGKNDATDEDVKNAISIAQAEEFVSKLENKENHMIAERGNNLSGGQKQRMCIARALVRNSEIVIFDDSFSALDYKTDKNLRNDLHTKLKDTTVVIVAQRIGTIKNADKIVVLDHGKIVGMGKHEDLLKNCKVYYEIATSQLDENELKGGK